MATATKDPQTQGVEVPKLKPLPPDEAAFKTPVLVRANFYRDNYRRLMIGSLFLVLTMIFLIAWILYERTHKPPVQYYATANDGRLMALIPLSQPNLTTRSLLEWAVEAGTTAYNFNFGNYQTALQGIRSYFTPKGYDNFIQALTAAGTLRDVQSKNLEVFAVPTDTPVILREGPTPDGLYAWEVQLPMLVTYQSAAQQIKQNIILTMLIARMPTLESPKGIGIAAITVRER